MIRIKCLRTRSWLTERGDLRELHEQRLETAEWAILIFVIAGVVLDLLLVSHGLGHSNLGDVPGLDFLDWAWQYPSIDREVIPMAREAAQANPPTYGEAIRAPCFPMRKPVAPTLSASDGPRAFIAPAAALRSHRVEGQSVALAVLPVRARDQLPFLAYCGHDF